MKQFIFPGFCACAIASCSIASYQYPQEGDTQCYNQAAAWSRNPVVRPEIIERVNDDGYLSTWECDSLDGIYRRFNASIERNAAKQRAMESIR